MLSAILHTVDFASIELAVSGKQSVPSGGVFSGEILSGVVSLSVLFHICKTGLCCAFSHLLPATGRPHSPSCVRCPSRMVPFCLRGPKNPPILLLPLEVTLPRVSAAPAVDCAVTAERTEPVI